MMISLAVALAALFGAALAHVLLIRARQRLGARILRRRRVHRSPGPLHAAGLALLALQASAWLAALRLASAAHPALAALRERTLGILLRALESPLFALSGRSVSALDLLLLPAGLLALWLAANGATQLLRVTVLRTAGLENGSEESVASLLRYGLLFLGALVVLQVAGLDVRGLAIAGGVLGVGIGFGLQNLANNFVSGLVIGLERPVRAGDFVRVGEHLGTVLRVGARSTALRTLDRVTILIPNSRFLETEVVNWSHGDPVSRVHVPLALDTGSNVAAVRAALLAAARAHPAVLREPRAQVQLPRLDAGLLHFELLVWTRDPQSQQALISDLNFRIEVELARSGVALPSSQVDVRLRAPELGHALEQLSGRPVAGAAPGPPPPPAARPAQRAFEPSRDERSPEEWTVAELEETYVRMRGPEGVARSDRRHWLRVHRDCFVGSDAVAWLAKHEGVTRNEARVLGERLVELGWVRHVLDEHGFLDGNFYYRFAEPETRA